MKPVHLAFAVSLSLVLVACASAPGKPDARASVCTLDLRIATSRDFPDVGGAFPSPYEPPDGLIFKSDQDFVVLTVEIESGSGGNSLQVLAIDAEGGQAVYLGRAGFIRWWKGRSWYDERNRTWERYLHRTYLPEGAFNTKRGKQLYHVVLMGKRPLAKPVVMNARFLVDGEERSFVVTIE
ncbi:MAG: hypothetical protein NT080_04220 [Spirochaetes bacterium]|nr:hypothetical protein [Spirochaetota bacterium]